MKNDLYSTYLMNWSPYSIEKTVIPEYDIKSSEYVYCCMINSIKNHNPFCVVRMGDGEAGLMKYYKTGIKPPWLGEQWCNKVGVTDMSDKNIKNIGRLLIENANKVDFLGSSIWGSSNSDLSWSIEQFINRPKELPRCSNWFGMEWVADGCAHNLIANFSFCVLHNNADSDKILKEKMAKDPRFHGKLAKFSGHFILKNDYDIYNAINFIKNTNFDVYLISGGPSFKIRMYDISRYYNKVLIDLGASMSRTWLR